MHFSPSRYAAGLLLACSAAFACGAAGAAEWPDKPITFVAPFTAGGANDLVARIIAKAVGSQLGQPVIVENRPGAGGVIGAAHVARSPADGYTYLVGSNGTVTNSLIRLDQPYKDDMLTPVALLSITPSVIVANPSNPAKDLKDFVARAKQVCGDCPVRQQCLAGALQLLHVQQHGADAGQLGVVQQRVERCASADRCGPGGNRTDRSAPSPCSLTGIPRHPAGPGWRWRRTSGPGRGQWPPR